MTLLHVVGARPNFVKAAPVIAAVDAPQELVHTGQHYDEVLSQVFFDQLDLPRPDRHLHVGSGSQASQTAMLMQRLEADFLDHEPDGVVVYGDVNSTLAAALVAAKLGIPIAHVESGLRSFDRSMPEEINRLLTDRLADLHFVTSDDATENLISEGIAPSSIHFVGNTMIDTLERVRPLLDSAAAMASVGIEEPFGLVTLHRPFNVDGTQRTRDLVSALSEIASELPLVFPIHPRGASHLEAAGIAKIPDLHCVPPLGYLEFMSLMAAATVVITDSGGVQEETTVLGTPCVTVRPNTERPVTITHGTNQLVEPDELVKTSRSILASASPSERTAARPPLWDGASAHRIAPILESWI